MSVTRRKKFINTCMNKESTDESIRYIIVGISTTLVNVGIYQGLLFFSVDYKIANIIAVVLCKIYGYIANKQIVFHSHCKTLKDLFKEMIKFVVTRGITGLIDYYGLILVVELFHQDEIISKYVISILVIFLNYLFGKVIVFRRMGSNV